MSETRIRNRQVKFYVTRHEREVLKFRASQAGMSVSEYVRQALIHSSDQTVTLIDTTPLDEALFELRKQGANLNQWMRFLNTYGIGAYESEAAARVREGLSAAYTDVTGALIALRDEAGRHKVVIDFEHSALPGCEEGGHGAHAARSSAQR